MNGRAPTIAYFSMEIALEPAMPTYSGGLGMLAGDTIRAAADLGVPMLAVTLLYREGYFTQVIDAAGHQRETPASWPVEQYVAELPARVSVQIEGRTVQLRAWQYLVSGFTGNQVPVLLLDTDLPENSAWDRRITHQLYGGDARYRLCQEIVLGIGGVRMLRALGYREIPTFHLNEGHAALLGLELLDEHARWFGRDSLTFDDVQAIRQRCVFTTHTPVPAGHDQFPLDLVMRVLGHPEIEAMREVFCCDHTLNMTFLALNLSHYVNGVAKRHGETARLMFAPHAIDAITNGVHAATWVAPAFAELFDHHMPGWRGDNFSLRYALNLPHRMIRAAHTRSKRALFDEISRRAGVTLDPAVLTLGFARRATAYKRADLLFTDPARLREIAARLGKLQLVFGGKAHPRDQQGKQVIERIWNLGATLGPDIKLVYLADYDMALGRLLTSGVDVWLNTPRAPFEASGTSGMKAALNGVPSLSVLDGWWIEGCLDDVTGWAIGTAATITADANADDRDAIDAALLYDKLEHVVQSFYHKPDRFTDMMRHAIALNGSFFNTHRMVLEYVAKAYFR
jgi:starch phosphorylase